MRKKKFFGVIFLIGLLIFLYPFISNWYAKAQQARVIASYDEKLQAMTDEELLRIQQEAEKINQELHRGGYDQVAEESKEGAHYSNYRTGEMLGYVVIEKLDIRLPIFQGVSEENLSVGVGHIPDSSYPVGGIGTHTVLTGHRGLPSAKMFRDLNRMQIGDIFVVESLSGKLLYKVYEIKVVIPTQTEDLIIRDGRDLATLVTCDPYMIGSHRMLVMGERVVQEVQEQAPINETKEVIVLDAEQMGKPDGVIGWINYILIYLERNRWIPTFATLISLFLLILPWRRKKKEDEEDEEGSQTNREGSSKAE